MLFSLLVELSQLSIRPIHLKYINRLAVTGPSNNRIGDCT